MLRLWLVDEQGPVWRASLESPHTGERHTFADPRAMLAFLEGKTASDLRLLKKKETRHEPLPSQWTPAYAAE